jgi:phosphoribosylaminoimidazole (AIR) synthetase
MGIGFTVIVPTDSAEETVSRLSASGETAYTIGRIEAGERSVLIV